MTTAFWFSDQADFTREAAESAASFKRHNPHCQTALFGESSSQHFEQVYPLAARQSDRWYLDSVNYFIHALATLHDDKLLYFDVDTYILGPLDDLINMIGRFDFIGAHAPARQTAPTVGYVPEAFPEINIGVLGINNSPVMKRFFAECLQRYEQNKDVYGNNDQAPLRESLWHNAEVRLAVMPPEYNCRFGFGGFAALAVKVLHGRGMSFEAAEKIVNYTQGMRAWTNADLHQMS